MSESSKPNFFKAIIDHHKEIHDIGIVIVALFTAVILYLEVKNIEMNSRSSLIIAKAQKKLVQIALEKTAQEFSTSVIDRLAKAVDLLSSSNPSTRLAGVYSLERLANDLPDESIAIARIIATFLTNKTTETRPEEIRRGFMTLLRIVKKIDTESFSSREAKLNLNGLQLENVTINKYSFKGFSMSGAYFNNVGFDDVDFTGIDLRKVTFKDCYVEGRLNFSRADLSDSLIIGSNFSEASFYKSKLSNTRFEDGIFHNVDFLDANMNMVTYKKVQFDGSIDPPDKN